MTVLVTLNKKNCREKETAEIRTTLQTVINTIMKSKVNSKVLTLKNKYGKLRAAAVGFVLLSLFNA